MGQARKLKARGWEDLQPGSEVEVRIAREEDATTRLEACHNDLLTTQPALLMNMMNSMHTTGDVEHGEPWLSFGGVAQQ
jgi:hypothetical protein